MERICICPGSFDPITVGHMDVIRRAAALFDRVIVAVLHNPAKSGAFPVEERLEMIRRACADLPQVCAEAYPGLLAEFVRLRGACCVVRGLRSAAEFDSESTMAHINGLLNTDMETLFLASRPEHAHISSSVVRELATFGGDFSSMVPECNHREILAHFAPRA